ncbi:hypothetical protein [Abyssicoccus albus]|uniref:hypothetical protein n=1 Tax=Abyssicoccus albus TaxID=1817405 RepID=UPI00097E2A33|nr:hypothetical protein [Abyssicoccus albus]AQL56405.1 hypothetical protein BVH56_05465 [Abyssicoccus albus]
MQIFYGNNKIRKQCTDIKYATKKFGKPTALNLFKVINFIKSAESLNDLIQYPRYSFHPLKRDKKHLCSMDIEGRKSKWRLYVIPCDENCNSLLDGYFDNRNNILHIELIEVNDHG